MAIEPLRFLVVEDHGFQRWLICDLLRRLGAASVQAVGDGGAALQVLAQDPTIDIVVSDLDMPGVDGMALFRQMVERGHRAGVLILSAQEPALLATVEAMARAYGVNLLATIAKPLSAARIESAVALHKPSAAGGTARAQRTITRDEIAAGMRRGEFEAFFQPKAEVRTGDIQGAEALVRWHHPYLGCVSPAGFMETVETTGLIDELTLLVARQAFAACRSWQDQGHDMGVSVNLSALSFSDVTLADRMTDLTVAAGIEQRYVTFEITETAASGDLGPKLENISRLRMRGFELSIDDFGTGYSSMHRLSLIPFTELKIDQSFVRSAVHDTQSRLLVESSINLAYKMGIRAVAEGVETKAQWEMLLGHGCPSAQGHFIARPMPAGELLDWLGKRRSDCA